MAGTSLIFGRRTLDIDRRVVTYEDTGGFSFYDLPPGPQRFSSRADNLDEMQHGKRVDTVTKVVLHHDGSNSSRECFSTLVQRNLSTHLMIDGDGTVYQVLNLNDVAWHCADANPESIGIDLNNPISPTKRASAGRRLYSGEVNGGRVTSVGYTEAQYTSLIAVLQKIVEVFPKVRPVAPIGIDGKVLQRRLAEPSGFSGIVGHLHISATKWDPGPGFDWERVLIGIRGKSMYYPVTLPGTQNLASVPKRKALSLAAPYFRNTETESTGGYFPFGLNQAWHTGVHLHLPEDSPVYAPADGVVKVARQAEPGKRGSANMLLIEHELEINESKRKCWTVLSHLRKEDLSPTSAVEWIRRLYLKSEEAVEPEGETDDEPRRSALGALSKPGRTALTNGHVALIEEPVKAGEIVGHTATFAGDLRGGKPVPLVDVAIIAGRPLVDRTDPTFEIVQEDKDEDILCNARAIWKRFTRDPEMIRGLVEGFYPLSAEEIREFFASERDAREMRRLVPRHVTEWSDATDVSQLVSRGLDFEWSARAKAKEYMNEIRPFLWWDDGVTRHAGLPGDRMVFAHHPIYLLAVLAVAEARRAMRSAGEPDKGLEGEDLRQAKLADAEKDRLWGQHEGGSGPGATEDFGAEDIDRADEGDGDDLWEFWEPGEWGPDQE